MLSGRQTERQFSIAPFVMEQRASGADPQTEAEYEAAYAQLLSEMQHLREKMDLNQAEIDRIKIETNVLKRKPRA